MTEPLTAAVQDYLKAIHALGGAEADVSPNQIAAALGVRGPSVTGMLKRLAEAGADGIVIFNRFFQPDIDIRHLTAWPRMTLSDSSDLPLRLRWLAILRGRVRCSLAATGGIETAGDAIKALRQVILLDERVRNTAVDLARISQEVADLRDRVSRLEGIVAAGMALSREGSPPRDRRRLASTIDQSG